MIDWEWTKEKVKAEDVLDAARTIKVNDTRILIDPISDWVRPWRYLEWASSALTRGGEEAWDCAAGWAKRTVCRRMDGILVYNHLGSFLGRNYKEKAEYLARLEVPGLALLRDMVIDPRNDIEHSYRLATAEHAGRACEVAELFLKATDSNAAIPAIAALGWNLNYTGEKCDKPGHEYERHEFSLRRDHQPMLLIDGYSPDPEVFVICPAEESVSVCPRSSFSSDQILELNSRLRQCLNTTSYCSRRIEAHLMRIRRDQLRL